MEDNAEKMQILKAIENQALRAKYARENQICRTPITKEVYEANKAKSSEETATLREEIADLKNDMKYSNEEVAEILVRYRQKP